MPASKIRAIDTYPMGWFQVFRRAAAAPGEWQLLAVHEPSPDGRGGTAKNLGNRLRSMVGALQAYPGYDRELSAALGPGHFTIRARPVPFSSVTEFQIVYRFRVNPVELIEKALAGG